METLTPAIEFKAVGKAYQGREVLSGLNFRIFPHEVVGLLGKSGMGKTTILKLVAGIEAPDQGTVIVHARRIGYVFQEPRLLPWKTALENIALPLQAMNIPGKKTLEKARELLELMGLSEFSHYYPAKLSGGMKQRVSLARAFAVDPEILLLDEPFSSLDIELKNDFAVMLASRLKAQPATVLYVSHAPEELGRLCSKVYTMVSSGALVQAHL